ncbi:hypothetical protein F5Y18DRAFT_375732 [Xylariaceae sp. FL1019]|nr:hypothetical protein F5Y18DRAFT_375732 [Xylariaceae sp. FL1019]
MSHPPSAPVKVPASAATYTPATQDNDLRSHINALMLREGQMEKIQENLLHSLDAHSSNWPSAIQTHALALLRSGEVHTFPALVRRVLEDVRRETTAAAGASSSSPTNSDSKEPNGTATNGTNKTGVNGVSSATDLSTQSLGIPPAVVETVLKAARESLEAYCEIEDGPG